MDNRIYYIDDNLHCIVTKSEWIRDYPAFAKSFGGRWNATEKVWTIPDTQKDAFISQIERNWHFTQAESPILVGNANISGSYRTSSASYSSISSVELPVSMEGAERISSGSLTVNQLSKLLKSTLNSAFPASLWVKGELQGTDRGIRNIGYFFSISGESEDGKRVKLDCVMWSNVVPRILEKFEKASLKFEDGLNVCLCVRVDLNQSMGNISLNVQDIDTSFSLGDLLKKRLEIIEKLKKNAIFDRNRLLEMPAVPLRIALITSPSGQAVQDFLKALREGQYGFSVDLWPAAMQGTAVEGEVSAALDAISGRSYDVVVITRGGGNRNDLSWFDSWEIARRVALLPIKVVVAIGHTQDQSVLDLIAQSCITPTDAGKYIVHYVDQFFVDLENISDRMEEICTKRLEAQKTGLFTMTQRLSHECRRRLGNEKQSVAFSARQLSVISRNRVNKEGNALNYFSDAIKTRIQNNSANKLRVLMEIRFNAITKARERLNHQRRLIQQTCADLRLRSERKFSRASRETENLELRIQLHDPRTLWKQGFALLLKKQGRRIGSVEDVEAGESISAFLADGTLELSVISKRNDKHG